jgi:hypothetical protein
MAKQICLKWKRAVLPDRPISTASDLNSAPCKSHHGGSLMVNSSLCVSRSFRLSCAVILGCMFVGPAGSSLRSAIAQPPTHVLADGTSYINIDIFSQATVYDWYVDEPVTGISYDHLTELSNWFRVDDVVMGTTGPETSVHSQNILSAVASNTNPDPGLDTLNVLYQDLANRFQMRIIYNITDGGPGSGISQLDEDISIFNLSFTDDLYIHVFEYVDLDLHSTPGDDTLELTGQNSLYQHDVHTDFNGSMEVDRYELEQYSNTLDKFALGNGSDLNDVWANGVGPIAGNVTWALQWDFVGPPPGSPPGFRHRIAPRSTAFIHKEGILQMYYVTVPEPASGTIAILGGAALALLRRRRRIG